MGRFAQAASQRAVDQRGDGKCVAGRWITDNLDEEDVVELTRLAVGHNWAALVRLSDNDLREGSLSRHVHGACSCLDDIAAKGCCQCGSTGKNT